MYTFTSSILILFKPFNCFKLYGFKYQVLYYEHNIKCWDNEHMIWTFGIAFPMLLIWIIVIPIFLFLKIYLNKVLIYQQDKEFSKKYGVLYETLNNSFIYWEFITIFHKIYGGIIVLFMKRFTEGLNGFIILLSLIFMYIYQQKETPFKSNNKNNLIENILKISEDKLINSPVRKCYLLAIFLSSIGLLFFFINSSYEYLIDQNLIQKNEGYASIICKKKYLYILF